ncbi:ATPase [Stutzerimonas kirkiae]|uniref:histidine kinase n=1 Tax=Stutzerimonas kirkiae TaxID=2211392 RepID=A0A4Q9R9S5_9GAMM|nr:ATP-binding protein [Stutzerimonas kirkiae]TBU96524.1 ATPase [Stutzerimonas kirkiae]TBV02193.1 ATPase [Stutzerimonas kirkiae]
MSERDSQVPCNDSDPLVAAVANCSREPIHIPGSIQPHGFLLVLDSPSLAILQASENVVDWLGAPADCLAGARLVDLCEAGAVVERALSLLGPAEPAPRHLADLRLARPDDGRERDIAVTAHVTAGLVIVEFEEVDGDAAANGDFYPLLATFIGRLQDAADTEQLCRLAIGEIKRLSGFGRVKAYAFDADGNGQVLAELADPGYSSYLGLHFPASDIPQQARALYCVNRIRLIVDADYRPSPLVPALNPKTAQPLDLSQAALRSVSPVHLQYMRNMRTQASMSISIVVGGRLWGLISCHHVQPLIVAPQTRAVCELLGRLLSLQIESRESRASAEHMLALRHYVFQLLSSMSDHDSVQHGLREQAQTLLDFMAADGAAVIDASDCQLFGHTPAAPQVEALAYWLAGRHATEPFHSDNLARDIPELPELADSVAGLLAVSISQIHPHYLIWFKNECIRTVNWAGKPEKSVDAHGSLDPRHSFECWQEVRRGYSTPWHPRELQAVLELRNAILGIVLRKAEAMAQLAGDLSKSNKELEAFSYSVSHDLRAPLRHIAGYAELLEEFEGERLSERGRRFIDNIADAARFAGSLVDSLLSFSQMGRAALHPVTVDMQGLLGAVLHEMQPEIEGRAITWNIGELPVVHADAVYLHQVLRNLLSNALKYSRGRNPAVIEIGAEQSSGCTQVFVRDNGVGFDMQYVDKLFNVFQRLHRMEDFEGTGIGLANVRRIIERHDGRVWAKAAPDEGATFYFTLPDPRQEI